MAIDLAVELIQATVQLEASYGDGTRNVGTGFLVEAPGPDGTPRVVLITAEHVLSRMPGQQMTIGYRATATDGTWKYQPQSVEIRKGSTALWVTAPGRDVAAIEVTPPAGSRETIPVAWLSDEAAFTARGIGPGDEMMALGYPMGMAANTAGFAILRSGKVASYPIAPSKQFPTFLLDFTVFPGNSGGPVFVRTGEGDTRHVMVTGLMTQQLETGDQSLAIGVVTQSDYIKQAIRELDKPSSVRHVARPIDGPTRYTVQPFSAASAAAQVSK
jgi:S1-C subfamily serine protease